MNSNEEPVVPVHEEEPRDSTKKQRTKRSRNVSEWNREKRKRLRVAGQEYVNSKGEVVQRRKIGADCKCRRRCYLKVNEAERKRLFDSYYNLHSHDEQNAYLFGLIRKHDIARRRSKDSEKRTCTFKYFVRIKGGKEVQVCRLALCHIHAISAHKVRLLCEKLDRNILFPRDERGRHNNRPSRIPEHIISIIKQHVLTILKSDKLKDFIKDEKQMKNQMGSDVNITKMWRDFLSEHVRNACYMESFDGLDSVRIKAGNIGPRADHETSENDDGSNANNEDNEESGPMRIDQEWSGTSVKLWLYNKVFHNVVTGKLLAALEKRISEIKNERATESPCFPVGKQRSPTSAKKLEPSAQVAISPIPQHLDSSQQRHQVGHHNTYLVPPQSQLGNQGQSLVNASPAISGNRNSFPFQCDVRGTISTQPNVEALSHSQFYRLSPVICNELLGQHFLA